VRYLTLTHIANVAWADSGTDSPTLGGLNDEGRSVVRELNDLGILVDLSHTSDSTARDVFAVARVPPIFSHSSARAVTDHPRNVPDDVLALLAAADGVAMVTFVPGFISNAVAEWETEFRDYLTEEGVAYTFGEAWKTAPRPGETPAQTMDRQNPANGESPADFTALTREWEVSHPRPRAGIVDAVAHVEHIREAAGISHVGLGGDYDGVAYQPDGLEDVSGYPRLLAALADRGWSHSDLTALTGNNILRVLQNADEGACH
jgi:membrane dipeptidase